MQSIPSLVTQLKASINAENEKLIKQIVALLEMIDDAKYNQADFEPHLERLPHQFALEKPNYRQLQNIKADLLKVFQKEYGMVGPGHYRTLWLSIGMAVFGIPFGLIFSSALNNFAFLGIGLPIGLSIGIAIGTAKDKQAQQAGKVIHI